MDKVTAKILNYFQEVLIELNSPKELDNSFIESLPESLRELSIRWLTEPRDGVPPTFMIVEQTEFSSYHSGRNNKFLGRWMVRLTSIEEFSGDTNAIEREINGMYYSHGFGEFSIHENGEIVRVGWQVGPLFGRGYEFSIVQRDDKIELVNQKDLWVS